MKVKSIKKINNGDVYNMNVEEHHNFSVNGGLIVHNCDATRYMFVMRTYPPVPPLAKSIVDNFDMDIHERVSEGLYD